MCAISWPRPSRGASARGGLALGVQVSTISRRIRDLEDNLGASLFHRHSAGARLTFAGQRFLERAREIDRQIGESGDEVAMIGRAEAGVVRIGLISSMASGFLPHLVDEFKERHADVELEYVEGGLTEQILAVQQHRVDVAFVIGPVEASDCDVIALWQERVCVVVASSDPLAQKHQVEWSDLRRRRFVVTDTPRGEEVHDFIVQHLAGPGSKPRIERQAVYRDMLLQIVVGGSALTLINEAAAG